MPSLHASGVRGYIEPIATVVASEAVEEDRPELDAASLRLEPAPHLGEVTDECLLGQFLVHSQCDLQTSSDGCAG